MDEVPPDLDPQALAKAEAALAALAQDYLRWAARDVDAMREALAGSADDPHAWQALFAVAHNIKGQAGTFGYPLITALGSRLCALIAAHPAAQPADLHAALALVDAIAEVLDRRLDGAGGAAGRQILDRFA